MNNIKDRIKSNIDRIVRKIVYDFAKNSNMFISINRIDVNVDFSVVKIYVSFCKDFLESQKYITKLNKKKNLFRRELLSVIERKKAPEIRFIFDDRFIMSEKIEKIAKNENF